MRNILFCSLILCSVCALPISAQAPSNPHVIVWLMDYKDASGTDHPRAVVIPASIAIDQIAQQVGITDYVYGSPDALTGVYQGKSYSPVGQHSYNISKNAFQTAAGTPVVNGTVASAIFGVCAQVSTTTLDVPILNDDGTPKLDSDGKPILQSFVANAQMKYLDLSNGELTPYP